MSKPIVWCILRDIIPIRMKDGTTYLVARMQRVSVHPRLGAPDVKLDKRGGYTQTSAIVKVDARAKTIETLNTEYHYV